jgi:hypothetical protein
MAFFMTSGQIVNSLIRQIGFQAGQASRGSIKS